MGALTPKAQVVYLHVTVLHHLRCHTVSHLAFRYCSRKALVSCHSCVTANSLVQISQVPLGIAAGAENLCLSKRIRTTGIDILMLTPTPP